MPALNLCRICLVEMSGMEKMQPLFEEENDNCAEILKKIQECGGIVLKPLDEFPKMMCYQCLENLNISHKFRSLCQASEHALYDIIIKSELKTEPQETGIIVANSLGSDSNEDVFFDLGKTEFIDAHEVDVTELTESKKIHFTSSDYDAESQNEVIEISNTDVESIVEEVIERKQICTRSSKVKPISPRPTERRGRPRLLKSVPLLDKENKKNSRGRKKMDVAAARIMCEICGNIYNKRTLLNMHMRRHMAEKPFKCEICGKSFACPSEIGRHMRVHTGEKPFVCRFCGRTFADRSSNIKHERIHTNERPFTCKTCGKSFTYSNVLKNHMLTHTGEKPFPCLACNKTFSRKHQLDQHCSSLTHKQTVKNLCADTIKADPNILESKSNDCSIKDSFHSVEAQ